MKQVCWIYVVIASLGIAAQAQDLFGADVRPVTESEAQQISGIASPGLSVEAVGEDGVAALLGLQAKDVILELNGTRTLQPNDLQRAVRSKDEGQRAVYLRDGRRRTQVVTNPQAAKIAMVLDPLATDDPDSPWRAVAEATGLEVDYRADLPPDFSQYAAVVIQHEAAVQPQSADDLALYLRKGGSVGLFHGVPLKLADNGEDMSRIAEWLGVRRLAWLGEDPDKVVLNANRVWGTSITSGQQLYRTVGRWTFGAAGLSEPGPRFAPVARVEQREWRHVGPYIPMFYNRYGDGRVFYSGLPIDAPDYPLLKELTVAAIRWLARVQE